MANSILSKNKEEYGEHYKTHIFEQYKIYVEMADRISQRRMTANAAYITIMTALLIFTRSVSGLHIIAVILLHMVELLVCFTWYYNIKSYRQLNSGKFKVIHEIESLLPLRLFEREWEILGEGKRRKSYWPLSHIEKYLPIAYGAIIFVSLIWNIVECF